MKLKAAGFQGEYLVRATSRCPHLKCTFENCST
jgi:hypothetical protein